MPCDVRKETKFLVCLAERIFCLYAPGNIMQNAFDTERLSLRIVIDVAARRDVMNGPVRSLRVSG